MSNQLLRLTKPINLNYAIIHHDINISSHSLIPLHCFILVRVAVDPEPILGILCVRWDHTHNSRFFCDVEGNQRTRRKATQTQGDQGSNPGSVRRQFYPMNHCADISLSSVAILVSDWLVGVHSFKYVYTLKNDPVKNGIIAQSMRLLSS